MRHGRATAWVGRGLWLATAFGMAEACSPGGQVPDDAVGEAQSAQFTNGGFETGAAGTAPPSWTLQSFKNVGITVQTPQTLAGLNLMTGGKPLTTILASATGPLTQPDPDLGATASLRWPRYGNQCATVNFHSSTNFMTGGTNNGQNVNAMAQIMTIGPGDVDPLDGKVHVRFVVAPVLQNPAHVASQQPYYMVQLTDVTTGALLYSDFNLSGAAGIPWKTINGGAATEIDYTDWQLVDISPTGSSLAMGDKVELQIIAGGCSPGGHFGEIYVDGVGATLPGLFVSGTGPAQANACSNITYNLTYENGAATPAAGVVVTFNTPPGTTFVSDSAPGLTCAAPAVGAAGAVTCTVGNLAAGAGGSFQVTVNVACATTGLVTAGNYSVQGTGITPLLGPHVNTTIGCATDAVCPAGDWCNETKSLCTPTLANGAPVPTDGPHTNPTLSGMCSPAAGALVCISGVCDTRDNDCGYANGDGPCTVGNADVVCRSTVCDTDGKCGYANGDGPCTAANGANLCRSGVCDTDGKCGYANGDGPCTVAAGTVVCRSGMCSTNLKCDPAGGCNVDADCPGAWCNETAHTCSPRVANGTPVPSDPAHTNPGIAGTCSAAVGALVCLSSVCDTTDNACGYAVGDGPCSAGNADQVCRSGACSANLTCEPMGGCNVDADCAAGDWCNESAHMCTATLPNGTPVPTDPPHTAPTLDGTCSAAAGTLVCTSGVCDTLDGDCGYANGDGPCTAGDGPQVCRSGICATSGTSAGLCVGCVMDSQCPPSAPTCSATTSTCVQCLSSATCPSEEPICDKTSSTCVPCNGDSGSTAKDPCASAGEPFCFLSGAMSGHCGKCTASSDCEGHTGNACNTSTGLCVSGCVTDADCTSGQWCDAAPGAAGMCQPKVANGAPLPSMPASVATCTPAVAERVCVSGACFTRDNTCGTPACTTDGDCTDGTFCSSDEVCTPTLPVGGACNRAAQCQNADCAGGVCTGIVSSGNGLICAVRAPGGEGGAGSAGLLGLMVALAGVAAARRRRD